MQDVAEKAGVSKSTVSQYLNGRFEYMSAETKKRIQTAIEALGYRPNQVAKSLKQKRTSTIGLIVANILHRFSTLVCRAVEDTCHEQDYHAIICNADDNPEKERKYIDMLRAKQVDGILVIPTQDNTDLYEKLIQNGYPLVFLDRKVAGLSVPSVTLNNREIARMAAQHLIQQGHEKISLMTPPMGVSSRNERQAGFCQSLRDHGLSTRYVVSVELDQIRQRLDHMLQTDPPTALVTGNDRVLMEALPYLKEKGISIPETLALISFDEMELAPLMDPPITTIEQPAMEMGRRATEILLRQIRGQQADIPLQTVFDATLCIRQSSRFKRGNLL